MVGGGWVSGGVKVVGRRGQAVIRKCGAKQHKPKDDLTIISVYMP